MSLFIDGSKLQDISIYIEKEEIEPIELSFPKEINITLTDVKTNMRLMSPETRRWCKQIKVNGLIYW